MKDMFDRQIKPLKQNSGKADISIEPNRVIRAEQIFNLAQATGWKPGDVKRTKEDHLEIIKKLEEEVKMTLEI